MIRTAFLARLPLLASATRRISSPVTCVSVGLHPGPPVHVRIITAADDPVAPFVLQALIGQPASNAQRDADARMTTQRSADSRADRAGFQPETDADRMDAAARLRHVELSARQQTTGAGPDRLRGPVAPAPVVAALESRRGVRTHEGAGRWRDHRPRESYQREKKSMATHPVTATKPARNSGLPIVVCPKSGPHGAHDQDGTPRDNPNAGDLPAQRYPIRSGQQPAGLRRIGHGG